MDVQRNRIEVRLSEDEMTVFKKKARSFQNVSAMVRKAVELLDDKAAASRLDQINHLSSLVGEFNRQLAMIGNNLNQITRVLHELKNNGLINEFYLVEKAMPSVDQTLSLLSDIKREMLEYAKQSIKDNL